MTETTQQAPAVYAAACESYRQAGWQGVIPVPPDRKFPPPEGFTGADGRYPEPADVSSWAASVPGFSVALRMPDGVIGIDVDEYVKGSVTKHGAQTVAAAEAKLGPLPPTYSSTARGPGPSRILFYQVPPGRYAGQLGPDVEIIQRHHRYAVVAPSPHAEAGSTYAWYGPDGTALEPGVIPGPQHLAWLPEAWVAYLSSGAAAAGPAASGRDEGETLLANLAADVSPPCVEMASALTAGVTACSAAEAGSRHDAMAGHLYELIMLAAEGHAGYMTAMPELRGVWDRITAGEDRGGEFDGASGFLVTAARKAATKYGTVPAPRDPCLMMNLLAYLAPAPGGDDAELPEPIEPPRQWSPFSVIGAEPFDPAADLDAPLARDVLARLHPLLRYAPDAGAWVIRGPEAWDVRKGDLAKWGVDLVSWLMLRGDPEAAEGSDDWRRARRKTRFCTNAPAGAIAGKMNAQVAAGHHPAAMELAAMDTDREILWAGGLPYDLRASADKPSVSEWTDPGTPHLHSAGVIPEPRKTPLWDAFCAAVWPDEEVRAWALRVLAIAFTGYPDKALPILLGQTDRGKTQIITLLMSVLGSYAHVADARLLSPAERSHASIVYALMGRLLSFIDESPRTGNAAVERLKQLTGGAELTGNRMAENPVTFKPTHTMILTANPEHEPVLTDAAVRRRVRLIPCDGDPADVIRIRAAIGNLGSRSWRAEAPGVLALMMAEAARWLADPGSGSNEAAPESGRAAAEEIRVSQDRVLGWLREECEDWAPGTRSRDLYMAFTESCRRMAVHPSAIESEKAWALRLTELGYPLKKREDANYRPVRVRPPQAFLPTPGEFMGASGGAAGPAGGSTLQEWRVPEQAPEPSSNGETPGQTIQETLQMEGMEGSSPLTRIHTHTHTRTQETGDSASSSSSPPGTSPEDTEDPESSGQPEDQAPPSPKVTRTRKAKAAPPRPDPELEGPVHPLPVLVARSPEAGAPPLVLPCTLDDARQAAETSLAELSVDCETSGYPPGHALFALRTVQLGGEFIAADFDPSDPEQAAVIADLLARAVKLHAHSAIADLVPLAAAGLGASAALWAKMEDWVLIAKLGDPGLAGSDENELKKLSAALLGDYAVSPPAEKAKNALFASGRWLVKTTALTPPEKNGWASVKPGCETMARYAGSDVLDLAAVLRVLPRPDEAVLARERHFQVMCARVAHQGFRLDPAHIIAKIAEFTEAKEAARERVHELCPAITNPSSTAEVPAALAAMGVPLGTTPGGKASAAKAELELLAQDPGYEHRELLRSILEYRHDVTTLGLLLEPLNVLCQHGDGRMRPVVYTINADTGRTSCVRPNGQQFCYTSSMEILTEQGFVSFPEIDGTQKVAQWSEDGAISFVTPLNVIHEAYDGPMIRIRGEHHEQVVTPNHRVYSRTREGYLRVEPAAQWLVHGARGKIVDRKLIRAGEHCAPRLTSGELLSLRRAVAVQADGSVREDCRFIGLGFTKQRKADRARQLGLEVRLTPSVRGGKRVYQAKAYEHQVSRWLSFPDKNFRVGELIQLDAEDLAEFIAEIMFWDGDFTRGREYSQAPDRSASVEAVEIAAILCGYSTTRRKKTWNGVDYDCVNLFPGTARYASRTWVEEVPSDGMVHCVEVPSGAVVVRHGNKIIVSGNSRQGGIRACVIADDGMAGISADFSGVEIRVGAALSGDADLLAAETLTRCLACGADPCGCGKNQTGLHWMAARMAFGPEAGKEDRYNSKRIIFSKMFGGGPRTGARQVGVPYEAALAVHRAFEAIAPRFAAWDQEMRAYADAGNRAFPAYSGRTIWLPRGRSHAAGNYAIQGTARELLVDGVLRWDQTRWGQYPLLPIHDEILVWIPVAEAEEALATLQACMRGELYGVPIAAAGEGPFLAWPDSS